MQQTCPPCAPSCFFSQVRRRYPCIRHSSEAAHGSCCNSSKRVQLYWQDAWKLSSDLATQEAFLPAVGFLGFCSHDMTQNCFVQKFGMKTFRSCYRNSAVSVIHNREKYITGNIPLEFMHKNKPIIVKFPITYLSSLLLIEITENVRVDLLILIISNSWTSFMCWEAFPLHKMSASLILTTAGGWNH